MRLLLVGAFIILLVILYSRTSRTEGFANLDKSTKCKLALINLTAAAEMPYFAQNDPTIFAKRVDKASNDLKVCSGSTGGMPRSQFDGYVNRINSAYWSNVNYCSYNPSKCDNGRKLLLASLRKSLSSPFGITLAFAVFF